MGYLLDSYGEVVVTVVTITITLTPQFRTGLKL
jgi:hypothetical protein